VEVYLVQHAEAKPETEDTQRPLSERGRAEAIRVASHAAKVGVRVSKIVHSGKLRARQTAEIFGQYLNPPKGVEEVKGLAPLDQPQEAREMIEGASEPLMVVGHLPHLSRLASLLVIGEPETGLINFRMAGIVCLTKTEEGGWRIRWILNPDIV